MSATVVVPIAVAPGAASAAEAGRFRLRRAGVLNVWQYDEQEFNFADGRLLLRGANGAGKSKTLEMLLPFALDGDKARITASAKHHTSLLWLMTDGLESGNRVGYVWVEFARVTQGGEQEVFTCGVGIRASVSARQATAWHFATDRRLGSDFSLEDQAGPLSMPRLKEVLGAERVFEKAAEYKAHVGRTLFGLDPLQYDEVLRLLYWLRQPQVGEDIEPVKLAQQLSQALPQLDEQAVRAAGDTFDELTAFGEQIERRAAAAESLAALSVAYGRYARAAVAERAHAVGEALRTERKLRSEQRSAQIKVAEVGAERAQATAAREAARAGVSADEARLRTLEDSPEFRDQRRLDELADRAKRDSELASQASRRKDRQSEAVTIRERESARRSETAAGRLAGYRARLRELAERQREAVPGSQLPAPPLLDGLVLQSGEQVGPICEVLDHGLSRIREARSAATQRRAGVAVVREAIRLVERTQARAGQAEREAEQAGSRWEEIRAARVDAGQAAESAYEELFARLAAWTQRPGVPEFALPADLTEEYLEALPATARAAAAPRLGDLRQEHARAGARREAALGTAVGLRAQREAVAAERDPAPPAPALPRTPRGDGKAFWQLVDFRDGVGPDQRAGLEAALQASGLLDAWVRPGGRLLDAEHRDVVLAAPGQAPVPGRLGELLVADPPAGCDVAAADIEGLLNAFSLRDDPDSPAVICDDGTWRLGPAHGRADKSQAQYIGATARAAERERRLTLLDAALAEQQAVAAEAAAVLVSCAGMLAELEAWVHEVPSGQELLRAWTRLEERHRAEDRAERENRVAQEAAHTARSACAAARGELERTAAELLLPSGLASLDALDEQLLGLLEGLRDLELSDPPIREALVLWQGSLDDLAAATESLAREEVEATAAGELARVSRAEFTELQASLGDSVAQLQARISAAKSSRAGHLVAAGEADRQVERLIRADGETVEAARNAEQRLGEHLETRSAALAALVGVAEVPGMLDAASVDPGGLAVLAGLAGPPTGEPLAREPVAVIDQLAGLSGEEAASCSTRVWRAHGEAASGPAADHQLVVSVFGEWLAVSGRDEAGEAAVTALAQRVHAGVARDRELLTDREKQQFEAHILGELGDAIRGRRRDAQELVVAMNDQLRPVTTSAGIRLKLDWKLRADVPGEAREAVALLAQPVGALIPEERAKLRDVLHRLIEASRVERPEFSYGEHLAAALDYRTWSEFTIRYTRPEKEGQWEKLHRRSALSQGEQKVLCYLPLFAAAAAHFTSLAGAAPYAPRLVLLDDAFPKIDVRTHPLLFGLLVQLDLDFVITSERLWGDHATVPSLAIYEALRDPAQRGIAQYEYRWDGRVLQGIG
ncbi:MAG: TIGR02680 family protein [Candidatus Nanopelagicales bacterium]